MVVLAVGLLFAWALRRVQRQREEDVAETREIILSRSLLEQQLARLWGRARRRSKAHETPAPFLSLSGEPDTRRSIRQIYQTFLAAMKERGRPRRRDQTPGEYSADLAQASPAAGAALVTVTDAYEQARYAAQSPDTAQVLVAEQAWEDIRAQLAEQDKSSG